MRTPLAVAVLAAIVGTAAAQAPPAPAPAVEETAPRPTAVARPATPPAAAPVARPPRTTASLSLIAVPVPEPRPVQVNDLVTILVNEQAELTANSQFNRQRRRSLQAEIAEFVRIADGAIRNSADTSPAVDVSLNGRVQDLGQVNDREGIRYRVTATVVSVLPNGNIVLEARKEIVADDDHWEYTLNGTIAADKINRDMTALAENCANLRVTRFNRGRVGDSTKRGWGLRLFDYFSPF